MRISYTNTVLYEHTRCVLTLQTEQLQYRIKRQTHISNAYCSRMLTCIEDDRQVKLTLRVKFREWCHVEVDNSQILHLEPEMFDKWTNGNQTSKMWLVFLLLLIRSCVYPWSTQDHNAFSLSLTGIRSFNAVAFEEPRATCRTAVRSIGARSWRATCSTESVRPK